MRKLKRSEMLEKGCIYCKYYNRWSCKLNQCALKNVQNNIENIVSNEEVIKDKCKGCGYGKDRKCVGFCMKKVLKECQETWSEKSS